MLAIHVVEYYVAMKMNETPAQATRNIVPLLSQDPLCVDSAVSQRHGWGCEILGGWI
jgi:hypothetical protein